MLCLVGQLPRQIQGMVVCFGWLINSHYKYRVWWCALFGWSASPTNTGYGGVLWLVDQLVLQIQGMVVCFVWLINSHYKYRIWSCPTNTGYCGVLCLVD